MDVITAGFGRLCRPKSCKATSGKRPTYAKVWGHSMEERKLTTHNSSPILQMRKLRPKEEKGLAQGDSDSWWLEMGLRSLHSPFWSSSFCLIHTDQHRELQKSTNNKIFSN